MQLPAFFGRKKAINLLPKDPFESSTAGVVLTWLLSFGKWAVIVTQLIVMGTFLWRFGLDRELTDLKKNIAKDVAIIKSYNQIERDFTLTQKRLVTAGEVIATQKAVSEEIRKLSQVTPPDVWYEEINLSPSATNFTAYSGSLSGFGRLLTALQQDKGYSSVTVRKIQDGGAKNAKMQFEISLDKVVTKAPAKNSTKEETK